MFTGIVQKTSRVISVSGNKSGVRARIAQPAGWKLKPGESVSIDGVCSTVASVGRFGKPLGCELGAERLTASKSHFEVEYMPETLEKTTAASFGKGRVVNLELPLKLGDAVGGHLVQGHVDTVGEILEVIKKGNSVIMEVGFPGKYRRFIAEKGSICVNGVSLTIVSVTKNRFSVSLADYTLKHTNLRALEKGDKVNLEVDIIARYLGALIR